MFVMADVPKRPKKKARRRARESSQARGWFSHKRVLGSQPNVYSPVFCDRGSILPITSQ